MSTSFSRSMHYNINQAQHILNTENITTATCFGFSFHYKIVQEGVMYSNASDVNQD
jgi:hypothetical protein